MPGTRKATPIEAFELTLEDAHHLVRVVEATANSRKRRMRAELRGRIGTALDLPAKNHAALDCIQSDDLFMVFLPTSSLGRADFLDARPLLRQAVVAGCAAFETYIGDKTMDKLGPLLRSSDTLTPRLRQLPLTLGEFVGILEDYERKKWGLRRSVEPIIRELAGTAPNRVGELLSMIGVENWSKRLDAERSASKGTSVHQLEAITLRRNKIAHEGDRVGRGRGTLDVAEVTAYLDQLISITHAIEVVVP